ncbi:MAG TPA: FKBP-type peptidyl-prolyl cis-trans isomerase [Candidatus Limnocylindrales bacterium]|nr:FKBP-type peptidyl-prolyl cis-trans isomerase [Candidatus Limnocylindrales bacterium]
MKKIIFGTVLCLGLAPVVWAENTNQLSDEKSRVSYAIGMMLGHNWQQQGLEVDPEIAARAIKDVQSGGATLLTQAEMQDTLTAFQKEFKVKQQKMQAELAVTNKAAGAAFLATNKNNPGVNALPDGLQYIVITNGTGAMPAASDVVTVNYRGTLIDGTEFDSSYKRGQPAQFPVGGVIRGWTEALQKMNVGSKWKLFIPSELAYGENGQRGIPPNSVLIFEVELLAAQAQPPPPAAVNAQPLTSDIIKVPSAEEMKKGAKIEVIKPEDAQKLQQQQGK